MLKNKRSFFIILNIYCAYINSITIINNTSEDLTFTTKIDNTGKYFERIIRFKEAYAPRKLGQYFTINAKGTEYLFNSSDFVKIEFEEINGQIKYLYYTDLKPMQIIEHEQESTAMNIVKKSAIAVSGVAFAAYAAVCALGVAAAIVLGLCFSNK